MTTEEAQKLLDAYCIAQQDRHCCGDEMQPALNVARDACLKAMLSQDVGVLLQRIADLEAQVPACGPTPAEGHLSRWHLANWTDDDFRTHIPSVRTSLVALFAQIDDLELKADMAGYESAVYLRGQDSGVAGVAGVAGRWRQALEDPIPAPGRMSEPLESLYRRTEALRTAIAQMDLLAEAGLCYFTLGSAREYLKDVRAEAQKVGIQGGLTEFKR